MGADAAAGSEPRKNAEERERRRDLPHRTSAHAVIGAYYDVYRELGYGFLEAVYQRAFAKALADRGMPFTREPSVVICFRGVEVGEYRPDFVVDSAIVVELKAARTLDPAHEAQLMNYLRASDLEVGLLFNFGPRAAFRRFVWSNARKLRVHSRSFAVPIPQSNV